jgi:hypothetical protein
MAVVTELGLYVRQRQRVLYLPQWGTLHPLIHWVPGDSSLEIKRLDHEAHHLYPPSADDKKYAHAL